MCAHCGDGKCVDEPTPDTAYETEEGDVIDRCPLKLILPGTFAIIDRAEEADAGHLPVAGGTDDQTTSFLDGYRICRAELAHWKAKALKSNE